MANTNMNLTADEQKVLEMQKNAELALGFTEPYTLADVKARVQEYRDKVALDPNAYSLLDSETGSVTDLLDTIDKFYQELLVVFPNNYSVTPGVLPEYTPLMKFACRAQNTPALQACLGAVVIGVILYVVMFIGRLTQSTFIMAISAVLIYLLPIYMNAILWAKVITWFVYGRKGIVL